VKEVDEDINISGHREELKGWAEHWRQVPSTQWSYLHRTAVLA
jgi:hypothetical protein